ncbi:flagellar biosynthetic protein FliO [Paenibacillus thailandensis]|uniref:Flagellar biosynthetic protein FliO n=1 Tax=Paenibacillus thailandensis TaxID=393250 RepID=A0ABW5QX77_9BACL
MAKLKHLPKLAWLGTASFACPAAAAAAASEDLEEVPHISSGSMAGSILWVIVSLAIVIALIYIVIKWLAGRSQAWGANRSLRSLGGVALGQNKSLQVVEVAGRLYVIGVGEDVTLLDRIANEEEAKAIITALSDKREAAWSSASLANAWRKLRKHPEDPSRSSQEWVSSGTFEQLLADNMSKQSDRKQQIESILQNSKLNERSMDDE